MDSVEHFCACADTQSDSQINRSTLVLVSEVFVLFSPRRKALGRLYLMDSPAPAFHACLFTPKMPWHRLEGHDQINTRKANSSLAIEAFWMETKPWQISMQFRCSQRRQALAAAAAAIIRQALLIFHQSHLNAEQMSAPLHTTSHSSLQNIMFNTCNIHCQVFHHFSLRRDVRIIFF
jgi:hypothetical protein